MIAILAGIVIGKMKAENLVEPFGGQAAANGQFDMPAMAWRERFAYAGEYTSDILKKIWLYIVIGIGVGAWIHGYVPMEFLARYAGPDRWYAVPLAVLIGIPALFECCGGHPARKRPHRKRGVNGNHACLHDVGTALSLPEFMILKKVMKPKLIFIFAGVVGVGIVFTGYLFNAIL